MKSKFLSNERPFHIPENNVSSVFVNEYSQFLEHELQVSGMREYENKNAENTTAIILYEYKQKIEKKLRAIMELTQEGLMYQNQLDQTKRENDELQALLNEKKSLKAHESRLTQVRITIWICLIW